MYSACMQVVQNRRATFTGPLSFLLKLAEIIELTEKAVYLGTEQSENSKNYTPVHAIKIIVVHR